MNIRSSSQKKLCGAARTRRGFTLAELLVTIALITVLAAVLLPTVAGQIFKGDTGRVVSDLQAVRGAVDQFLADIRRYPGKYSDLSSPITTTLATHSDINGSAYSQGAVNRWKGPYVTKDLSAGGVLTGFGGTISDVFGKFTGTNADYLTVVIIGIDSVDFQRIDEEIDGPSAAPGNQTAGAAQWNRTGGIDSTKFFAIPIQ